MDLIEYNEAVKQLDLFSYEKEARKEPLFATLANLREKFGSHIIDRAVMMPEVKSEQRNIGAETSFNKDFLQDFPYRKKKKEE